MASVTDYLARQDTLSVPGNALAKRLAAVTSSRGILGRTITDDEADIQIAFSNAARDRFNAESAHFFARPDWMLAPWRRDLKRQRDRVFPIVRQAMDDLRHSDGQNDGLMNHYVNGDFQTSNDAEMLTIMVGLLMGAQDNIASAVAWWLAFMGHYPDIQDQIAQEVQSTGSDADSLNRCRLLKASVLENLRMRPAAQANQPRLLNQAVEIAGHTLPKRSFVLNSFYNMHHNAEAFAKPETYDPTRFVDTELVRAPQYAPFGHGPRNCVAQGMALQQMIAIGAGILRDYRIVACQDAIPAMEQTPFLVPASFDLKLVPR